MKLLPTLFLSHGSPMHALSPGVVGDAWSALGKRIDRPDAILMCSAHWETALPMVSGNRKPETIHDFGGFPQALYEIRYPAPGAPALAARVIELLKDARAHFADHCAICHSNDGSGQTPIGKNVYPKAPDLRLADSQSMSDGELFWVIHNGIRFTAMPAWGSGDPEKDLDSWKLVHFIRHLPRISQEELDEMKTLNPKTEKERLEEAAFDQFLQGDDAAAAKAAESHHH